jgi:hypothetical protein
LKPGQSVSIHIAGTTAVVASQTYPQTLTNTATATPTNGSPASGSGSINVTHIVSQVQALPPTPPTGSPFPLRGVLMLLTGIALVGSGMLRIRFRRRHA